MPVLSITIPQAAVLKIQDALPFVFDDPLNQSGPVHQMTAQEFIKQALIKLVEDRELAVAGGAAVRIKRDEIEQVFG